jgi:hypothetical protein
VEEQLMAGGNAGGAVRIDSTVRRQVGPWTPAVHALLHYLEEVGFTRAPRALGIDEQGREVLSFLAGNTVADQRPWPPWVHSDDALVQVARWLRNYHLAVAGFQPPKDAHWREGTVWRPGLIVGHNDAAPYNAVWSDDGQLRGFFDWDLAAPVTREWDLAFTAFAWVPLHARHIVQPEGFTAFPQRPRRLRLFLTEYGWTGDQAAFAATVQARIRESADRVDRVAAEGDLVYQRMRDSGVAESLRTAAREIDEDPELTSRGGN